MKLLRLRFHRLNIIQASIILMIIGLFLGVLFANVFKSFYYDRMMSYHNEIFTDIVRERIDYKGLFIYVLGKSLREFAVFWLLSITILGIPYMIIKIIAFGFSTGFFISAIAMQYGFKGLLLILVYKFPHGLIYLPLIILCLYRGYNLSKSIYYESRDYIGTIRRQLKSYMMLWLFLIALLVLGCFLEAYVGSFLLKKALSVIT